MRDKFLCTQSVMTLEHCLAALLPVQHCSTRRTETEDHVTCAVACIWGTSVKKLVPCLAWQKRICPDESAV